MPKQRARRHSLRKKVAITSAEAGRRAWRGTTKAQRSEIMRQRALARWAKRNGVEPHEGGE